MYKIVHIYRSGNKEYLDGGYFWLSYAQDSINDGMTEASVFLVSEDIQTALPNTMTAVVDEHDENGRTKSINSIWSANIFRSGMNAYVNEISFHTTDNNVNCRIFINNLGKTAPTDPGETNTDFPVFSSDIPYAGWHTVTLPHAEEIYSGDYYSVIVKMTLDSGSSYEYPTAAEAAIAGYIDSVDVKKGESFFAEGEPVPSVWVDGFDIE